MNKNQSKTLQSKKKQYEDRFEKFKKESMKHAELVTYHKEKRDFFLNEMSKAQVQYKMVVEIEKDLKK